MRRALFPEAGRASDADALATPPKIDAGGYTQAASGLQAGELVGPYRLIHPLGAGGMAEVWLAQRADGAFKREVALKLPALARLRKDLASRFVRERDILAALEHPNIARLYDAPGHQAVEHSGDRFRAGAAAGFRGGETVGRGRGAHPADADLWAGADSGVRQPGAVAGRDAAQSIRRDFGCGQCPTVHAGSPGSIPGCSSKIRTHAHSPAPMRTVPPHNPRLFPKVIVRAGRACAVPAEDRHGEPAARKVPSADVLHSAQRRQLARPIEGVFTWQSPRLPRPVR
jgi:hypothetical protein